MYYYKLLHACVEKSPDPTHNGFLHISLSGVVSSLSCNGQLLINTAEQCTVGHCTGMTQVRTFVECGHLGSGAIWEKDK